jgi:molybdopterin converting factor small subunit
VQTYDYLRRTPETAAILGWEQSVDVTHLEERRRFFTIWLARTLGLDSSDEFARYLFRAGQLHAGRGLRHIHTPPEYVLGSIGLVLAAFARFMAEAELPAGVIAGAMGAWSQYFAAQQHLMLLGYQVARDLEQGEMKVRCTVYGRLRSLLRTPEITIRDAREASLCNILRKLFNAYPHARIEALDRVWRTEDRPDALWQDVVPIYTPRRGWRVLLNGRDVQYAHGFETPVQTNDHVAIFPPGR